MLSCSTDRTELRTETEISKSHSNQGDLERRRGGLFTFVLTLGHGSLCKGFGICELVAFGFEIIEIPAGPNNRLADVVKYDDGSIHAIYALDAEANVSDTTFYVDENKTFEFDGKTWIIKAGNYSLDNKIGDFGGYDIAMSVQ